MYITLRVEVPAIIEHICLWFLLLYRKWRYDCAFRKIYLTKGKYAIVSPEDFEGINQHKWRAISYHTKTFYAMRTICKNGVTKQLFMHRVIMNPPAGYVVDHGDGDGLNNTRDNLSIVTAAENSYNRRKITRPTASEYKGVSLDKRYDRYRAQIAYRGIRINLGSFDNEIDAAKAYDEAAKKLYKDYAKLNFE